MSQDRDIAIVGIACRFPGAGDVGEYWGNLLAGRESIRRFTEQELRAAGVGEEHLASPRYVRASPVVDDLESFDAAFFGMAPREAEIRDPQHRLFLEVAYSALEDAGRDPYAGEGVGVYAGSAPNAYKEFNVALHPDRERALGRMAIGIANAPDYVSTTVSYKLGLQGPSINVLTACSSSLVAVHLAVRALRDGEVDTAVAGGVSVELQPVSGYYHNEGGIHSKSGHCRPFDAGADGTVFGTGCGVVVLRRFQDAVRDGDRIYAVIRGSAVNNDASDRAGFTAPGVSGQRAVITAALDDARITAADLDYVEAHGTGTLIGDPIEVAALSAAFRSRGYRDGKRVLISSVKGNIGHLGPAAGVAGLIKAALALRDGKLPPQVNYDEPNPKIGFETSPFEVPTSVHEWEPSGPRRAGVSSFGIGGTNAHVVLGEPPRAPLSGPSRAWQLLVFSAKTETALAAQRDNLAAHFAAGNAPGESALADAAHTLAIGRPALRHRQAAVVSSAADPAGVLGGGGPRSQGRLLPPARTTGARPDVAFLFSGQGSQHWGMAGGLYGSERVFTETVDELAGELQALAGFDIRDVFREVLRDGEAIAEHIDETRFAQPVLFVAEYALWRQWAHWGVRPAVAIGHSVGEITAATAAGVFEPGDALRLVVARGALMQSMPAGRMLAVPLPAAELDLPDEVAVAAVNAADMTVVAGPPEPIEELRDRLARDGVVAQPLRTSHAFHSAAMDDAVEPFTALVADVERRPPTFRIVSNTTGEYLTDEQACDPAYWGAHLRQPVQFARSLARAAEDGCTIFLEVGPGQALTSLARRQLRGTGEAVALPSLRHPGRSGSDGEALAAALGTVWTRGVGVDWRAYYEDETRMRAALPGYPFERKRLWLDGMVPAPLASAPTDGAVAPRAEHERTATGTPRPARGSENSEGSEHGVRLFLPVWNERSPAAPAPAVAAGTRWLVFTGRDLMADDLVAGLRDRGDTVVTVSAGSRYEKIGPGRYLLDATVEAHYDELLADLRGADALPDRVAHLWLADDGADAPSRLGDVERDLDLGFHSLLGLTKALARHAAGRPVHVDVVSRGAFGAVGDEPLRPVRAAAGGIVELLPRELAPVRSRQIDLRVRPSATGPGADEARRAEARQLLTELLAAPVASKTAVRGRKVWTWGFREEPVVPVAAAPRMLRERGIYLITGGLGGLGLVVAEDLARLVRARVVLTTRSPFPDPADWDRTLADPEADAEVVRRIHALRRIEELGGSALVVQADVTDREAMARAVELCETGFGRVDGVFHAAGLAGGGMMALKPRSAAQAVFEPKIGGLRVIEELVGDRVDFMVLFSSIASVATEFGLADYAGANAVLDAYAYARAEERPHVVSVSWGGWSEVGMAVDAYRTAPAAFRAVQAGLQLDEIGHPLLTHRGRLAGQDDLTQFATLVEPGFHWVVQEHQFGGTQVWPGTALLELARAAFEESCDDRDGPLIELRDVMFMAPLAVTGPTEVRTVFFEDGPYRGFSIVAAPAGHNGRQWTEYARGRARRTSAEPRSLDLTSVWSALPVPEDAAADWKSSGILTLGEHWQTVVERRSGRTADGTATTVARLRLPEAYRGETEQFGLHPSLLDCATALVLDLPDVTGSGRGFLPLSYGRLLIHHALPDTFSTLIRHKGEPGSRLPAFDVTLVAENGDVVAEITDFAVKVFDRERKRELLSGRTGGDAPATGSVAGPGRATIRSIVGLPERPDPRLTNEAGLTALRQVLDGRLGPHVIAVNEDLAALRARIAEFTSDRVADARPNRPAAAGSGGAAEPPGNGSVPTATPAPSPAPTQVPAQVPTAVPMAAPVAAPTVAAAGEVLLALMRDTLGHDLALDDDFFEQGGNSLLAIQVAARIREHFGIELPLVRLFDAVTVRGLAEIVVASGTAGA